MHDLDDRFSISLCNVVRQESHIPLHIRVIELSTDKSFNVKYGVAWIFVEGMLGTVANETFVRVGGE